jgi:hypothetical protein
MRQVKHQFTNKSIDACLSRSKANIYNADMSENKPMNGLVARLTELNVKGFSKTEMAKIAGVSKQAVSGWFKTGELAKNPHWLWLMLQVYRPLASRGRCQRERRPEA